MKKTLVRAGSTVALTVVLAAGVGAGTASAAPALPAVPGAVPAYCTGLFRVVTRPEFASIGRLGGLRIAERVFNRYCVKPDGSTVGSGYEGGLN